MAIQSLAPIERLPRGRSLPGRARGTTDDSGHNPAWARRPAFPPLLLRTRNSRSHPSQKTTKISVALDTLVWPCKILFNICIGFSIQKPNASDRTHNIHKTSRLESNVLVPTSYTYLIPRRSPLTDLHRLRQNHGTLALSPESPQVQIIV